MSAVVKQKLLLYADDSAILGSSKNKQDIETMLSSELDINSQWLVTIFLCILVKQNLFFSVHREGYSSNLV